MKNNSLLEETYKSSKKTFINLKSFKMLTQESIEELIVSLVPIDSLKETDKNNFDINKITKILKIYIDELTNSFKEEPIRFKLIFDSFILSVDLLTELCVVFAKQKEKNELVYQIFQKIKESKNMIKLFIPLEPHNINVINNYIGKHLYLYTHLHSTSLKSKELEYVIEEYFMKLESMLHGYELSSNSDANNSEFEQKAFLINNCTFILLKMVFDFKKNFSDKVVYDNRHFRKIVKIYKQITHNYKLFDEMNEIDFLNVLLEEFKKSADAIFINNKIDMYNEKIKLLKLNTDDYKQLIDMMLVTKSNS